MAETPTARSPAARKEAADAPFLVPVTFQDGDLAKPRFCFIDSDNVYRQILEDDLTAAGNFAAVEGTDYSLEIRLEGDVARFPADAKAKVFCRTLPGRDPVSFELVSEDTLVATWKDPGVNVWAQWIYEVPIEDAQGTRRSRLFPTFSNLPGEIQERLLAQITGARERTSATSVGLDEELPRLTTEIVVTPEGTEFRGFFDYAYLEDNPLPAGVRLDPEWILKTRGRTFAWHFTSPQGLFTPTSSKPCNPGIDGSSVALIWDGVIRIRPTCVSEHAPLGFVRSGCTADGSDAAVRWNYSDYDPQVASFFFGGQSADGRSSVLVDPTVAQPPDLPP